MTGNDTPSPRGISPRALWLSVALVLAVGLIIAVWFVLRAGFPLADNGVKFKALGDSSVSLAAVLPTQMRGPQGIDASSDRLYVAESESGVVRVLGPKGQAVSTITVEPSGAVKLSYPTDVAVAGSNLVVIDQVGEGAASLIPQRGGAATRIGGPGTPSALVRPTAVAFGANQIAIADSGSHSIKLYDASGRFQRELGTSLSPRLGFVSGLLIDGNLVWVSDSNAGRVVALDRTSGKLVTTATGKMQLPRGLAADPYGRVYVADEFARVVRYFDRSGKSLGVIGDKKTVGFDQGGQLESPRDVTWLDGRIYVTDRSAGVIRVYNVKKP